MYFITFSKKCHTIDISWKTPFYCIIFTIYVFLLMCQAEQSVPKSSSYYFKCLYGVFYPYFHIRTSRYMYFVYIIILGWINSCQACVYCSWFETERQPCLVVECWHQVWEVLGSIPSQGPRHTKDIIKMVPVFPLLSTEH